MRGITRHVGYEQCVEILYDKKYNPMTIDKLYLKRFLFEIIVSDSHQCKKSITSIVK